MRRTRICDLLGIEYPTIQGGMLWLAITELAAAISNTGALGTLSPHAGMEKNGDPAKNLQFQIAKAKKLAKKPFAINIPLDLEQIGIVVSDICRKSRALYRIITRIGSKGSTCCQLC